MAGEDELMQKRDRIRCRAKDHMATREPVYANILVDWSRYNN